MIAVGVRYYLAEPVTLSLQRVPELRVCLSSKPGPVVDHACSPAPSAFS
jgi:hypothetical protein